MTKPVILTVDDEPEVLNAVERDLRKHYAADYRILKAGSGAREIEVDSRPGCTVFTVRLPLGPVSPGPRAS